MARTVTDAEKEVDIPNRRRDTASGQSRSGEALANEVPTPPVRRTVTECPAENVTASRNEAGFMWWMTTMGDHPAFLVTGLGAQLIAVVPALELVAVMASEYDITDAAAGSRMVDAESASELVRAWVAPAVEAAR